MLPIALPYPLSGAGRPRRGFPAPRPALCLSVACVNIFNIGAARENPFGADGFLLYDGLTAVDVLANAKNSIK